MADDSTLRTSRILPFSPKDIYAAFASADLLALWWGPEGFSNSFEIFEFTAGGRWKFVMHGPDGKNYLNESVFEELVPDSRIVIRHDCPPNFTLTVELTPDREGTRLTWEQVFENAETAQALKQRAGSANDQNIDRLTVVLRETAIGYFAGMLFLTARLGCRRWQARDLDDVFAVYSDEEGARWVGDGLPITYQECERWMEVTFNNYEKRGYGMFALIDRQSGALVGFCGLVHPGNQAEVEIKYAFYKAHWGKGYASEIVPAMLSYAANKLGVDRVIATVAEGNRASQRVLLKSGMEFVGIEKDEGSSTHLYEWRA